MAFCESDNKASSVGFQLMLQCILYNSNKVICHDQFTLRRLVGINNTPLQLMASGNASTTFGNPSLPSSAPQNDANEGKGPL